MLQNFFQGNLGSNKGLLNPTSLFFNGTTQYVTAPTSAAVNPDHNTPFWTSFWIQTTQGLQPTLISNLNGSSIGLYILLDAGKVRAGLWHTSGNRVDVRTTSATVNNGLWHSVVIVYSGNGLGSGWTIYVDGVSAAVSVLVDTLSGNTTTTSATLSIGADLLGGGGSAEDFFVGYLNQFSFTMNATLSAGQVTSLYNGGFPVSLTAFSPGVWQYFASSSDTLSANGLLDHGSAALNMTAHNMTSANVVQNTLNYIKGKFNSQCLICNGTTTSVDCGSDASLQPALTDSFSINFWIKITAGSVAQDMSFVGNTEFSGVGGWNIVVNSSPSGRIQIELDTTPHAGSFFFGIEGNSGDLPLNVWANIGASYDGSNSPNGLKIYRQGALLSTTTYGFPLLTGSLQGGHAFTIGSQGLGQYVEGLMDEVTFWDTVLDATDFAHLYNNGVAGNAANMSKYAAHCVSYWRFEQVNLGDTLTTVHDQKGSNTGTITSGIYSLDVP